jgi:hypothetical protein
MRGEGIPVQRIAVLLIFLETGILFAAFQQRFVCHTRPHHGILLSNNFQLRQHAVNSADKGNCFLILLFQLLVYGHYLKLVLFVIYRTVCLAGHERAELIAHGILVVHFFQLFPPLL